MMAKSISASAKRKGRPVTTGTGTTIGVRMLDAPLAALDSWIDKQKEPDLSRPEWFKCIAAIHRETKGSEEGRKLAHEWSAGSPSKYDPDDLDADGIGRGM